MYLDQTLGISMKLTMLFTYFVSYIEILVFWLIVNVFFFLISLLK